MAHSEADNPLSITPSDLGRPDPRTLVTEHWASVYRLTYRLSANVHDAEELTQETFARAIQRIAQFQTGTSVRNWLLRIATNQFLDTRRKKRPANLDPDNAAVAIAPPTPPGEMEQQELARALQRALQQLPENQRTVFLLRSTEDLPFRDIAEVIGTSEATARWHMLQARERLLGLLEGKI